MTQVLPLSRTCTACAIACHRPSTDGSPVLLFAAISSALCHDKQALAPSLAQNLLAWSKTWYGNILDLQCHVAPCKGIRDWYVDGRVFPCVVVFHQLTQRLMGAHGEG